MTPAGNASSKAPKPSEPNAMMGKAGFTTVLLRRFHSHVSKVTTAEVRNMPPTICTMRIPIAVAFTARRSPTHTQQMLLKI